jgi:hypothetical protein
MTHARPATVREQRLSERLDSEWRRLRRRPALIAEARSWGLTPSAGPPIRDLDDVLRCAGHHQPPSRDADAVLAGIVSRARTSPLAARVTLQRILPGLLALARTEQRREPGLDAFELLVAEAWCTIVSGPPLEHDDHVAPRLLNRARQRAFTNPRRRLRVGEALVPGYERVERCVASNPSSFEELVTALGDARRAGLADRELRVLSGWLRCGTTDAFAAELKLTPRAVRYRREHAVARVRRLLKLPRERVAVSARRRGRAA